MIVIPYYKVLNNAAVLSNNAPSIPANLHRRNGYERKLKINIKKQLKTIPHHWEHYQIEVAPT